MNKRVRSPEPPRFRSRLGRADRRLPRINGADVELGNFILGRDTASSTAYEASRAVLRRIEGVRAARFAGPFAPTTSIYDRYRNPALHDGGVPDQPVGSASQDYGRRFLPSNGGCAYIDLNHLELCIPEVVSAFDHVAAVHAMLRIAREALARANYDLPVGEEIKLLFNNSDGRSNSYGSHLNFLVERRTWDDLFERRLHHLLLLASHQVSSIVFTGQGKVGAENGRPWVDYQLSQRADFFECLQAPHTTYDRPIVNSRDEALCGSANHPAAKRLARLHCIFFDSTLAHVATVLKVGTMQIVLTMLEAGIAPLGLLLDDPVSAVTAWSHDVGLQTRCRLACGKRVTAVELQLMFLEEAAKLAETGYLDAVVPRAREILGLWERTLASLAERDFDELAGKLDWVLKLQVIEDARSRRPHLAWDDPEVRYLDQIYSSVDANEGLYWLCEAEGLVDRLVTEPEVERFVAAPPQDTRAYTRAMLLRAIEPDDVDLVDWDAIRFELPGRGMPAQEVTVHLTDPTRFGRSDTGEVFEGRTDLPTILDALAERLVAGSGTPQGAGKKDAAGRNVSRTGRRPDATHH
jgi:hypothetical protein